MSKNLMMFMPDLDCVYRWNEEWKELMWCPLFANNIVDMDSDEWGPVDESIVGGEEVVVNGKKITLSEVYRDVELKLGVIK